MKVKAKYMMEDLREYTVEYNTTDIVSFANKISENRVAFPFIIGYEIELIKEEAYDNSSTPASETKKD